MKNKAFTLVEILVVILIIGILAAIAVPQYQKAVEKARMTEAITAVEKIAQAQQIYRMANGNFTQNIHDLDIDYPRKDITYCGTIPGIQTKHFVLTASNCVGEQTYISLAQRAPEGTKYVLSIALNGEKNCKWYTGVSDYEKQLCQAWTAGK